jgi:hypothetical protein
MHASRDFDNIPSDVDWKAGSKGGTIQLGPDIEPSKGSAAMHASRDFDNIPSDVDWKAGSKGGTIQLEPDTEPSKGLSSINMPRKFDVVDSTVDWKQVQNTATTNQLGVDTTPSTGSSALAASRKYDVLDHDTDWKVNGGNPLAGHPLDLSPSKGSSVANNPRDFDNIPSDIDWKHSKGGFGPDQPGAGTIPSTDSSLQAQKIRTLGAMSAEVGWQRTASSSAAKLLLDTEPSMGSTANVPARDYDVVGGDATWKAGNARSSVGSNLDVKPSVECQKTKAPREFEVLPPGVDWNGGQIISSPDQMRLDGSLFMESSPSHRQFDALSADEEWKIGGAVGGDRHNCTGSPSEGSSAMENPRDFDVIAAGLDWKHSGDGSNATEKFEFDPDPSIGSSAMTPPRLFDGIPSDVDWKLAGLNKRALADPRLCEVEPSGGSPLGKASRDFDAYDAQHEWLPSNGRSNLSKLRLPGGLGPSGGNSQLQPPREYTRFPAEFAWKGQPLSNQPRNPDANALEPHAVHPANHSFRSLEEVSPERAWKPGTNNVKGLLQSTPEANEPMPHHIDQHKFRELDQIQDQRNWQVAGEASAKPTPVAYAGSVVDVAMAKAFPFRVLDKFVRSSDWNMSPKPEAPKEFPRMVRVRKRNKDGRKSIGGGAGGPTTACVSAGNVTSARSFSRSVNPSTTTTRVIKSSALDRGGKSPKKKSVNSKMAKSTSVRKGGAAPTVSSEKAALVSYLDELLQSGGDVLDEVTTVFERLADAGCSQEEISGIVEMCSAE